MINLQYNERGEKRGGVNIKRKNKLQCAVAALAFLSFFATTVSAYHFRGYFSRNVGYGNQAAYSDDVYKVVTNRNWVLQVTKNSSKASMKYEIVNSSGASRGGWTTSSGTLGPTQYTCTGEMGYKYRLKVTKMSNNLLKAYPIEANWDTDAN